MVTILKALLEVQNDNSWPSDMPYDAMYEKINKLTFEIIGNIPKNDKVAESILGRLQQLENAIYNIDMMTVTMPDIAKEYANFKGKSLNLGNIEEGTIKRKISFSDNDSEDEFEDLIERQRENEYERRARQTPEPNEPRTSKYKS